MNSHDILERLSDADVMLRVQWGNEAAFAVLYGRYYRRFLNFFYGMSRDVQVSEDLCHETFLRLWNLRARYSPSGAFPGYAFSVARLIWLEYSRRARKPRRLFVPLTPEMLDCPHKSSADDSPEEQASRAEVSSQVFDALEKLPEEQRMAFVLRTVECLPLDEIAAVMQCPVNTVRSRRLLAVRRLRELLQGLLVL